jgi:hypothetical protein
MIEPSLDLDRVPALGEQHARAGVAEGVKADPRTASLLGGGLKYAAEQVVWAHDRAVARWEHEVVVARPLAIPAALAQGHDKGMVQRNSRRPWRLLGGPTRPLTMARRTFTCGGLWHRIGPLVPIDRAASACA